MTGLLIFQSRIYRADLKANPHAVYVFGDNEQRWGLGGQAAEMRGEPNAIGVATLEAPGKYWSEARAAHQIAVIDADFKPVFSALQLNRAVVFPLDGIGTGLADLERRSPTTFNHLQAVIADLKALAGA
jgi:hypothetical protein